MTYIEFFDKTIIENICASLISPPDRVILIGDRIKLLESHAERYGKILKKRGYNVEFICKSVNRNNMKNIIAVLSSVVEKYDDCVFELTGGDETFLVAAGIISERYKDRNIRMHRFNIRSNTVGDLDFNGETVYESKIPELTVEENIQLYGGDVIYGGTRPNSTPVWKLDEDFTDDIDIMWDICRKNVRRWNMQIGVFAIAGELEKGGNPLNVSVSTDDLTERLEKRKLKYILDKEITDALCSAGLADIRDDGFELSVSYKNAQVKKCLTKAGQILEMKVYISALRARDKDGAHTYNDVRNGVCIDWDGDIHTAPGKYDTENEIDVMMMRGMIPVFVSCKNGCVETEELYKLSAVAEKFGGEYAKKVLIATALDERGSNADYLRERARDMNIRLVEKIQDADDSELQRIIRSFWSN